MTPNPKHDTPSRVNGANPDVDLTYKQVCEILSVTPSWLQKHRKNFVFYRFPGRGRTGQAIRYTKKSVDEYRKRMIRQTQEQENPYAGKTVKEIAAIVHAKHERERAGVTP